jgi:hypothetical protein
MATEMHAFLTTPWTVDEAVDRIRRRLVGERVETPYSAAPVLDAVSSGTTRTSQRTPVSLASIAEDAEVLALTIFAHGLEGLPWNLAQPGFNGTMNLLRLAKLGIVADDWLVTQFSNPRLFRDDVEAAGLTWPHVELLTPERLQALAGREGTVLDVVPITLAREVTDPKAVIRTGGGPGKLPGQVVYRYSRSEIGPIAISCPEDAEALHVLSDRIGIDGSGVVSRLGANARRSEALRGDAFDVEAATCACPLTKLGLSTVVRNVRRRG